MEPHEEWLDVGRQRHDASSNVLWDKVTLDRCDPYLVWGDASSAFPEVKQGELDRLTVLVEFNVLNDRPQLPPGIVFDATHWYDIVFSPKPASIRPYLVNRRELAALVLAVVEKRVKRFEMQSPRQRAAEALPPYFGQLADLWRLLNTQSLFIPDGVLKRAPFTDEQRKRIKSQMAPLSAEAWRSTSAKKPPPPPEPLVGVIDDACNFASPRWWRNAQVPSIRLVWDQGARKAAVYRGESTPNSDEGPFGADRISVWKSNELRLPPIIIPPGPTFPTGLTIPSIAYGGSPHGLQLNLKDELVEPPAGRSRAAGGTHRRFVDVGKAPCDEEMTIYRRTGFTRARSLTRWTHGSAVLDLVAGGSEQQSPEVVFVQLPQPTVEDTSGASLAAHALDGLYHILETADGRDVVVNLSYGTNSGPHDGTSLFEAAISEMLLRHKNLHLVLPAGNMHLSRTHCSEHVGAGQQRVLRWKVLADDPTDNFMEIWFEEGADFEIRVQPPVGPSHVVRRGHAVYWRAGGAAKRSAAELVRAGIVFPDHVAQGNHGTMALIAVAPTRRLFDQQLAGLDVTVKTNARSADRSRSVRKRVEAPHGVWTITLTNLGTASSRFHAWIQRDDSAPGGRVSSRGFPGRQSYFLDSSQSVDPSSTMNGIATLKPQERLRVVGSMRYLDKGLSVYSAAGPDRGTGDRLEGPDVVTISDYSLNIPGLLVRGMLAGSRVRINGTSMAAAVISGLMYRHLRKGRRSDSFLYLPVTEPTTRPIVPAGAPTHAQAFLRGEYQRVEPYEVGPQCVSPACPCKAPDR